MKEVISQQEFSELLSIKGQTRGIGFKTEANFVLKDQGEEGLKRLEKAMAELGFPYDRIKEMEFYPIGWLGIALVTIKNLFGYDDKKFREMGQFEAKSSLIIRLFMKYFVSLQRVASEASAMWRKYYTIGELEIVEMDEQKKQATITVKNFKLHPILCQVLMGYYMSILKMILNNEVIAQETKCIHKGDEYHEFVLKWN
jgi:hypothetical protein